MKDGPLLLTLDLGTTNCKGVVFDAFGREIARSEGSYPTYARGEGGFEQRPADWLRAADVALRGISSSLGDRVSDVAGLSLSAWGPGLVLLSPDGSALNNASPTWQDARSTEHGKRLIAKCGSEWIGGGIPTTGFPAKLAWAREEWPDLARRTRWALGVKEFVLYWLTGEIATEPSSGPYGEQWPIDVIEETGWRADQLPTVLAPTAVGGTLAVEKARWFGLSSGLPVVMGLNDGASATLGAGCHGVGDGVISLGTNGVYRLLVDARPPANACLESALFRYPFVEGLWIVGGFTLSGGNSLRWLVESVLADGGESAYESLIDEASTVPAGADGATFLPYLVGRGTPLPDPEAAAAFVGLRLDHGRAHMTRAVLEGVAFALRDIEASLRERSWHVERLIATGGGARNPLWRSVVAGVLGRAVAFARGDSNLGAAIVLAVALSIHEDLGAAVTTMVRNEDRATAPAEQPAYDAAYARYRDAVSALYEKGRRVDWVE